MIEVMIELWNTFLGVLGSVLAFFYDFVPNYGVAIILLTLVVRFAMVPLIVKQTRSMKAMQKLQPEIKKLRAKYKGDRQKMAEAQMQLFQEHGASPLGGCLPLLLQLPIFFALFRLLDTCRGVEGPCISGLRHLPESSALFRAIEAGQSMFLGMDLTLTPSVVVSAEGIISGLPYFALMGFMALTSWLMQKQTQSMQQAMATDQTQQMMQRMFKIMPFLFVFFAYTFPTGLTVYWTSSNAFQIGQQAMLLRADEPAKDPPETEETPPKPKDPAPKPKGSGARKKRKK